MEKIPAACALEWSIELEKGLRSKKPGHCIEAIKKIGYRLHQWSMEPIMNILISNVYGMVPGEDILFTNTILLRLADAFCNGDMEMKRCILKVFLVEFQHINKNGKLYNGILVRERVPNYLELLKRLKTVYDTGEHEVKSLTLRLLGCWASLAKDSSHIRFLILTGMQSDQDLLVTASLFAAGCFCRLSDDFSCIILKMLICIISSITRPPIVRLAAVRALAKLRCSATVTNDAYKTGRKALLDLPTDAIKAEMLSSLSKLALATSILFLDQIDLLQSFLSQELFTLLKPRALQCLYTMLCDGTYQCPLSKNMLSTLYNIFDDNIFPLNFQCLCLQILQKIFSNRLLKLPISDMPDLFKLVVVAKNVDTPRKKRFLALALLVDIMCFVKEDGRDHCVSSPNWLSAIVQLQGSLPTESSTYSGLTILTSNLLILIMDHVNFLLKEIICSYMELNCAENLNSGRESFITNNELKNLLKLSLRLAQVDPSSYMVALSRLRCIVHSLVSFLNDGSTETCITSENNLQKETSEKDVPSFSPFKSDGRKTTIVSPLVLYFCRFANTCLIILYESYSITNEVYCMLMNVVDCFRQCGCFYYNSFEFFCLIENSFVFSCRFKDDKSNEIKCRDDSFHHNNICWLRQECLSIDFTKKMLQSHKFWEIYRAGKYSCLHGLWFSATFSFRRLITILKSGCYSNWIKALMAYVGAESEIKLFFSPKVGLKLLKSFQFVSESNQSCSYRGLETDSCVAEGYDSDTFVRILHRVCGRVYSSKKALESSADFNGCFLFQRWFLNLRGKLLEIIMEIFRILSYDILSEDEPKNSNRVDKLTKEMHTLACTMTGISFRLNNLAKSYDLLATSFMDIDAPSFRDISSFGIVCSTLAFCASFATKVLSSPALRKMMSSSTNNPEIFSNLKIAQDLAKRLWDIDCTTARKLMHFILVKDEVKHGVCSMMNVHGYGLFNNGSLSLSQSLINDILCIQDAVEEAKDMDDLIAVFFRGLERICWFIRKWMELPSNTPNYFFKVRPCIGSELFILQENSEHEHELFVKPGFQLPLNLCIQLKNSSGIRRASISKIYCILAVRASDRFPVRSDKMPETMQCGIRIPDDMIWLCEILQLFLKANSEDTGNEHHNVTDNDNLVTTFVCFEPSKQGLAFSSCLLNTSSLPEGSYPIKWHSCCIDDHALYWNLIPLNYESVLTIKKF